MPTHRGQDRWKAFMAFIACGQNDEIVTVFRNATVEFHERKVDVLIHAPYALGKFIRSDEVLERLERQFNVFSGTLTAVFIDHAC